MKNVVNNHDFYVNNDKLYYLIKHLQLKNCSKDFSSSIYGFLNIKKHVLNNVIKRKKLRPKNKTSWIRTLLTTY